MTSNELANVVSMYTHAVLRSVDDTSSAATKMFQAGVSEGINDMVIQCHIDDYQTFKAMTEYQLNQEGYTRYGTSLRLMEKGG